MEETQEVEKDIMEGRHHVIDAAIVRIMKAKKTLSYEQVRPSCQRRVVAKNGTDQD